MWSMLVDTDVKTVDGIANKRSKGTSDHPALVGKSINFGDLLMRPTVDSPKSVKRVSCGGILRLRRLISSGVICLVVMGAWGCKFWFLMGRWCLVLGLTSGICLW